MEDAVPEEAAGPLWWWEEAPLAHLPQYCWKVAGILLGVGWDRWEGRDRWTDRAVTGTHRTCRGSV